jgi:hypothetical protein
MPVPEQRMTWKGGQTAARVHPALHQELLTTERQIKAATMPLQGCDARSNTSHLRESDAKKRRADVPFLVVGRIGAPR